MAYTSNRLKARLAARTYIHNVADATVATKIAWVAMSELFLALATLVSGTGILTFKIFAATDVNGTGATVVAAHADPTVADAAGDQVTLEVSAEQVRAALANATHVAVEMDCDHADDIVAVTYIRNGDGRHNYDGLTGDVIA